MSAAKKKPRSLHFIFTQNNVALNIYDIKTLEIDWTNDGNHGCIRAKVGDTSYLLFGIGVWNNESYCADKYNDADRAFAAMAPKDREKFLQGKLREIVEELHQLSV